MGFMAFIEWLDTQVEKKGWTRAGLARKAGLSPTAIYLIADGKRQPGVDLCNGVARALNLPRETVYREAGLLPSVGVKFAGWERVKHIFESMTPVEQEEALDVLEALAKAKVRSKKDAEETERIQPPG